MYHKDQNVLNSPLCLLGAQVSEESLALFLLGSFLVLGHL